MKKIKNRKRTGFNDAQWLILSIYAGEMKMKMF